MATCPICKKAESAPAFRPFCSRRCADIDLHRWLSGGYAIAGRDDDDDVATEQATPAQSADSPDDDFRSSD